MGDIEKNKMTRVLKKDEKEVHQIMTAFTATTIRDIVKSSNELGIKREDIVSLLRENGQYVLIYYK